MQDPIRQSRLAGVGVSAIWSLLGDREVNMFWLSSSFFRNTSAQLVSLLEQRVFFNLINVMAD